MTAIPQNAARENIERRLHRPAGTLARAPWSLDLDQVEAGWQWSSLKVLAFSGAGTHSFSTGDQEMIVLPLSGSCEVTCAAGTIALQGRAGAFDGTSDFAYLPMEADVLLSTDRGGRFALPGAKAGRPLPFRYQAAEDVPVELRGAGSCSRRVANYCMPGTFDADRLMACEVLTPAGNWSSYPPHKHDEERPGETQLEEIYYFEVAAGPAGQPGFAYQRLYGTPKRPLDFLAEVRSGDVVLVPHGYHGPSMAAPGYDLYYLNVMSGPGPRAWRASDDPAHAWVRGTWDQQHEGPQLQADGRSPGTTGGRQ